MTAKLEALHGFIKRMREDHGLDLVCVGGAARDTYLGRTPKDYDLVLLTPSVSAVTLAPCIRDCAYGAELTELGADGEEYTDDDNERGLENVFEFKLAVDLVDDPITVQVLRFNAMKLSQWGGDPYCLVEEHDCDLNKAWFEEMGDRLIPRVHGEFPSPRTGNANQFSSGYSNTVRRDYIRAKFPEFHHIY